MVNLQLCIIVTAITCYSVENVRLTFQVYFVKCSFQQEDVSVQLEALDILGDLLSRFGGKGCTAVLVSLSTTMTLISRVHSVLVFLWLS